MCARYELDITKVNIVERFGLTIPASNISDLLPSINIRPTNIVPGVQVDRSITMRRWGLDVSWQKQPVINARAETVQNKPTFRPLLNQRVLIPASAYFEWRKDRQSKIKTRIALADASIFTMAGLFSGDRFVILTCSPTPSIAHIHNRMPVVLTKEMEMQWINPDMPFEELAPRLTHHSGALTYRESEKPTPNQHDRFSQS
ncbi:MAG: SOS response-associated peptidase [Rhodospirillaceae bacterium]|nr:SOS response-associated peptidase [Rhodospirillaceae bacterium]